MKTKITKDFTLEELYRSNTAIERGIDNSPGEKEKKNIIILATKVLQPIRTLTGGRIFVSSGYRNLTVNRLVGGVDSSQHTQGKAADISSEKMRARELFKLILNSGIVFDQIILYDDGKNNFVHISYNEGNNRRQILYSKNTKQ